jgi:long-chain acyl-CoA synthetase
MFLWSFLLQKRVVCLILRKKLTCPKDHTWIQPPTSPGDRSVSSNHNILVEEVSQHYSQGSTIKEILVMPDPQDGRLVAVVVPDLDHFQKTGETDIQGEVEWEIEYYSQQLPPYQRIRDFVLTNQELPKSRPVKTKTYEGAALYQELANRRLQRRRSALAVETVSAIGQKVVKILQAKTGSDIALDDYLGRDLGLDSLALVELLAALEATFGIQVHHDEFVGILTVAELIRFIEGKQPQGFKELQESALTWGKILQSPPPLAMLQQLVVDEGLTGRLLNFGIALWLRVLFKLFFNLQVYGWERLGPGGYLLCPNHGSFLDGFLLFAAVPQVLRSRLYFLGYNNYFEGPVVKDIARYMHVVPVNSARHLIPAMQASAYILRRGGVLGIFPEGARTLTGELRPFKNGVAVLAQEAGVPLVPVYIHGSYRAWGPNARFPGPHPIQIIFGREFPANLLAAQGRQLKPGVSVYEAIILGLRQEVLNLRGELQARISDK